jgi:hypothetical protein
MMADPSNALSGENWPGNYCVNWHFCQFISVASELRRRHPHNHQREENQPPRKTMGRSTHQSHIDCAEDRPSRSVAALRELPAENRRDLPVDTSNPWMGGGMQRATATTTSG